MASRTLSRVLRSSAARQITTTIQKRTLVTTFSTARATIAGTPRLSALSIQKRGIKTVDFAGVKEEVYGMLIEFPPTFPYSGGRNSDGWFFRTCGLAKGKTSCELKLGSARSAIGPPSAIPLADSN